MVGSHYNCRYYCLYKYRVYNQCIYIYIYTYNMLYYRQYGLRSRARARCRYLKRLLPPRRSACRQFCRVCPRRLGSAVCRCSQYQQLTSRPTIIYTIIWTNANDTLPHHLFISHPASHHATDHTRLACRHGGPRPQTGGTRSCGSPRS